MAIEPRGLRGRVMTGRPSANHVRADVAGDQKNVTGRNVREMAMQIAHGDDADRASEFSGSGSLNACRWHWSVSGLLDSW